MKILVANKVLVMVASLLCLFINTVEAKPNMRSAVVIEGIKVFQDHINKNKFYYADTTMTLAEVNGVPKFEYRLNRYMGKRETSDQQVFRVRGLITFEIKPTLDLAVYQAVKQALIKQHGQQIEMQPAPISNAYNKLIYTKVSDEGVDQFSGEIDGGVEQSTNSSDGKQQVSWSNKRFTIGLLGNDAELFWSGFESNDLLLSLAYGWHVDGVEPDDGLATATTNVWKSKKYKITNTLPLTVSSVRYPTLFSQNEIWQDMSKAHTKLTIACYDFINALVADLYYVLVEVKFKTNRNQDYIEKVKFVASDAQYEKTIHFKLAKDLRADYQYRISRLFNDGELNRTKWLPQHDASLLDVSLSLGDVIVEKDEYNHPERQYDGEIL